MLRKRKPKKPVPLVWWDGKQVPITQVPKAKRPKLSYEERWLVSMYPQSTLEEMDPELAERHYGKKKR